MSRFIRFPKHFAFAFSLFLFCCLSSNSIAQYNIGHSTITFQDPSRSNRNIPTEIYYPATSTGNNPPAVAGSYPVIVFGHGFAMAWSAYQNIWEHIVPRGYIIAFPTTEGSLFSTNHQAFGWDLQFLVSALQAEGANNTSILYNVVAPETALMGHSMGGGAAFLAADSLCQNNNSFLKTLVGLAPAESTTNNVSSINSARTTTVPSLVLSGGQDGVTPPVDHHIPMYDSLNASCKTFLNILGGAHCYFANTNFNCDLGEATASTGISITRLEQQDIAFDFMDMWLDFYLKGICQAFTDFQDSLQISTRINHNQSCNPNPVPLATATASGLTLTAAPSGADSYQWIDCPSNSPINNATTITYTGVANQSYAVIITQGNCADTSSCIMLTGTNINTVSSAAEIAVFPNPSSDWLTIDASDIASYEYKIYDLLGQIYYQGQHHSNRPLKLSTKALASGVYWLQIQHNNQLQTIKLIKK